MKYHRGHRRSCGRVELGRGFDFEWDLTGVPLPRIKLWPDDRGMLIGISVGDRNSDPIVGVDIHLLGRVGQRWADWLWRRRLRKQR